jgi:Mce-associated membrane protein
MAGDAAAPDREPKTVTRQVGSSTTAQLAPPTEGDTVSSLQIGGDEMPSNTAELASPDPETECDTPDDVAVDYDAAADEVSESEASTKLPRSPVRLAAILGLIAVVGLAALVSWLGIRAYQSHQIGAQRNLFLQVGRQGAINLTTIDWQHADADIQRILASATSTFYDDFSKRSQPFVDVVKQAQSKSVGTTTEAGLESETDNAAQVLVSVSVKTSNAGAAEQQPRAWRMRIFVQKVGNEAKVSNVEFVP